MISFPRFTAITVAPVVERILSSLMERPEAWERSSDQVSFGVDIRDDLTFFGKFLTGVPPFSGLHNFRF